MEELKSVIRRLAFLSALVTQCFMQKVLAQQRVDTTLKVGSNKRVAQVQKSDYLKARREFTTRLIKYAGSPQSPEASDSADTPPTEVTQVLFKSGNLTLKAWINTPKEKKTTKNILLLFFCMEVFPMEKVTGI